MAIYNLSELVLDSLADDYENLALLDSQIGAWAKEAGKPFSKEALLQVIEELIARGLVEACNYDAEKTRFDPVKFQRANADHYWFRLTAKAEQERSKS